MSLVDLLRDPKTVRVLERAATAGAVPVSIHSFLNGEEGFRIVGTGECAVCRYVSKQPGGKAACRRSRIPAEKAAFAGNMPTPLICHLGLACMVVPLCKDGETGYVATFGPYYPAEERRALEADIRRGLAKLEDAEPPLPEETALPVSVDDIHVVSTTAIPQLAEWTLDELRRLWAEPEERVVLDKTPPPDERTTRKTRRPRGYIQPAQDPYGAAPIAAAFVGGRQDKARSLVRAALEESGAGVRADGRNRARAGAIFFSVIEAAEKAGMDTKRPWEKFATFFEEIRAAKKTSDLAAATVRALSPLKRRQKQETTIPEGFERLNEILLEKLVDGITLNDVAAALGEKPSTITRRLQRKFGLSFSDYMGRLRVEKAKDLLRRTRLGIGDVARRVGISDVSNLAKLFRKFEALSPAQYREQHGRKR